MLAFWEGLILMIKEGASPPISRRSCVGLLGRSNTDDKRGRISPYL